MPTTHLSFVVPVRDGQRDIAFRIADTQAAAAELSDRRFEIVVVDDGSRDATVPIVREIAAADSRVRLLCHPRPRGLEAAGQTGLERATGELVFILESGECVRAQDLRKLYRLADDQTLVAARVESQIDPVAPVLIRRLQQWGLSPGQSIAPAASTDRRRARCVAVQLIRRRHLQTLSGVDGKHYRLESASEHIATTHRRSRHAVMTAAASPSHAEQPPPEATRRRPVGQSE